MSDTITIKSIPQFDGSDINWGMFKVRMESFIHLNAALAKAFLALPPNDKGVIEATALEARTKANQQLYAVLIQAITSTSTFQLISHISSSDPLCGTDAWFILCNHYENNSMARQLTLTQALSATQTVGQTLQTYIHSKINTRTLLKNIGHNIPDKAFISFILGNMLPDYEPLKFVIMAQMATKESDMSLPKLLDILYMAGAEYDNVAKAKVSAEQAQAFLAAQAAHLPKFTDRHNNKSQLKRSEPPPGKKFGECWICGATDHKQWRCPKNKPKAADAAFMAISTPQPSQFISGAFTYMAHLSSMTHPDDCWIIDSGSNNHLTSEITDFQSDFEYFVTPKHISGINCMAVGEGTVKVNVKATDGSNLIGTFTNVYYVPSLGSADNIIRILSQSKAQSHDSEFIYGRVNKVLLPTGHAVSPLALNGLYYYPATVLHSVALEPIFCAAASAVSNSTSAALWHTRLGHLSKSGMQALLSAPVTGFTLKSQDLEIPFCDSCAVAKSHVANINRGASTPPNIPNTIVGVDIWGPMSPALVKGHRWCLQVTDHTTSNYLVYFGKTKSEVATFFDSIIDSLLLHSRQFVWIMIVFSVLLPIWNYCVLAKLMLNFLLHTANFKMANLKEGGALSLTLLKLCFYMLGFLIASGLLLLIMRRTSKIGFITQAPNVFPLLLLLENLQT